MPDYTADLRWLAANHPDEYARIPPDLLADAGLRQLHLSEHGEGTDGPDEGRWTIVFYNEAPDPPGADMPGSAGPEKDRMVMVTLSLPRPAADSGDYCPQHTLAASRPFCARCSPEAAQSVSS